jgi:circadian clock protein KaiB
MQYILKLYIHGNSPLSVKAAQDIERVCEAELKGRYRLKIIDVEKDIESAEKANIMATPTLDKELPLPLKRILGDLANKEKVLVGLDIARDR